MAVWSRGFTLTGLKDAGDPVENAAFYQKEGADELAMLDIAATLENRKTRLEWVKNVSSVIEIPLTVGGGISSLEDIDLLFAAGADKASMNSAAVNRPALVSEAARKFGSGRITVAVDARRNKSMPSGFELVVSGGRNPWERRGGMGETVRRIRRGSDTADQHGRRWYAGGI
jgi:cyclase